MNDRLLGMLGLMKRSGSLETGFDRASEALKAGKVKLFILPTDAPERVRRNAETLLQGRNAELITATYTRSELAAAVGTEDCTCGAVTDIGFAGAFLKALNEKYPDRYAAELERVKLRHEKVIRRKAEKPGPGRKSKKKKGDT